MQEAPYRPRKGDIVWLRKPHPCGSRRWSVYRTGADIGLQCLGCGKRRLFTPDEVRRRLVKVERSEADEEQGSAGGLE